MNEYRYEVFYQFDGPSHSQPFVTQKTDSQINDALQNFVNELPHYINDLEAQVKSELISGQSNRIKVVLQTSDDENSVTAAFVKCLQSLDLRADRI